MVQILYGEETYKFLSRICLAMIKRNIDYGGKISHFYVECTYITELFSDIPLPEILNFH